MDPSIDQDHRHDSSYLTAISKSDSIHNLQDMDNSIDPFNGHSDLSESFYDLYTHDLRFPSDNSHSTLVSSMTQTDFDSSQDFDSGNSNNGMFQHGEFFNAAVHPFVE